MYSYLALKHRGLKSSDIKNILEVSATLHKHEFDVHYVKERIKQSGCLRDWSLPLNEMGSSWQWLEGGSGERRWRAGKTQKVQSQSVFRHVSLK